MHKNTKVSFKNIYIMICTLPGANIHVSTERKVNKSAHIISVFSSQCFSSIFKCSVSNFWVMPPRKNDLTDSEREEIKEFLLCKCDLSNKHNRLKKGAISEAAIILFVIQNYSKLPHKWLTVPWWLCHYLWMILVVWATSAVQRSLANSL